MDSGVNLGSLLRLFKSEHFNCHLAITYLYKYNDHKPICDYLANECYSMDKDEIDYYLPQLWYALPGRVTSFWYSSGFLVANEKAISLERFLLDQCATCIHFALKITWLFSALINIVCSFLFYFLQVSFRKTKNNRKGAKNCDVKQSWPPIMAGGRIGSWGEFHWID
jgi:hypothetical protein